MKFKTLKGTGDGLRLPSGLVVTVTMGEVVEVEDERDVAALAALEQVFAPIGGPDDQEFPAEQEED